MIMARRGGDERESFVDLILAKILRIKQILANEGKRPSVKVLTL